MSRNEVTFFVMNVTQTAARSPCVNKIPALIQNSTLFSMSHQRTMTLPEMLEVQGFPVFVPFDSPYVCPFQPELVTDEFKYKRLPTNLRSMVGNSMHVQAIGHVLLFFLGCTVLADPEPVVRFRAHPLRAFPIELDNDDNDDDDVVVEGLGTNGFGIMPDESQGQPELELCGQSHVLSGFAQAGSNIPFLLPQGLILMDLEACDDGFGQVPALAKSRPQSSPKRDAEAAAAEPKTAAKRRRNSAPASSVASSAEKKCRRCKRMKPTAAFYQSQAQCTDCSQGMKNLQNLAKRTGERQWLRGLDESQLDHLLQSYNKEKARANKERSKIAFNLAAYKEKHFKASGVRKEARRRLMTEEQFYMWAKSAEGGCMSSTQAQQKWDEYMNDPNTPQEGEGKFLKLGVPIFIDLVEYDDAGELREVERQARLGAKLSEEQIQAKAKDLVFGNGHGDEQVAERHAAAVMNVGVGEVFVGRLAELPSKSKKAKKTEGADDDDDNEDATPTASGQPGPAKSLAEKWFDASAERAKAGRKFSSDVGKAVKRMEAMRVQMEEALHSARARATATSASAKTEMMILDSRLKALNLVHSGSPDKLDSYVKGLLQSDAADVKSVNTNGTANEQALVNFGIEFSGVPFVIHVDVLASDSFSSSKSINHCRAEDGWALPQFPSLDYR